MSQTAPQPAGVGHLVRAPLSIHGIVTLAAAVVLAALPAAIPTIAGISLDADEFLLSYILAAVVFLIARKSLRTARR